MGNGSDPGSLACDVSVWSSSSALRSMPGPGGDKGPSAAPFDIGETFGAMLSNHIQDGPTFVF